MTVLNFNRIALFISFTLVTALLLLTANNIFFWDTVLHGSKVADFYFSNHFSHLLLPDEIDSGHIPAFGMYIALVWKIFGRTLLASHFAILPFAWGIVWQLYRLCIRFVQPKFVGIALMLNLIDPSLLSQITLVSPDVPLVFFFLLAINSVLDNKKGILALSLVLLFLLSIRGMMLSVCLLALDLYCNIAFRTKIPALLKALLKRSLVYIPAVLVFVLYYSCEYIAKGWIGTHENSPWAACYEVVDFKGFLFNIALLGWRMADFGRVAVWFSFFVLLAAYRKIVFQSATTRLLLFFMVSLLLLFPANLLWSRQLGVRYFIPLYVVFSLLCTTVLFSGYVNKKLRNALCFIWAAVVISGNFWVYPDRISEGWDSTLAHLPYYELRQKSIAYLDASHIPFEQVQTFFPNVASMDMLDLNGDQRGFKNFDGTGNYVLVSNVNNIGDADLDKIETKYKAVKRFEKRGVYIVIYRKP